MSKGRRKSLKGRNKLDSAIMWKPGRVFQVIGDSQ